MHLQRCFYRCDDHRENIHTLAVPGVRLCMEEHGMVDKYKSREYDGGAWLSHEMEAKMEVAPSRMRVG